jgi:hypothetical protein
MLTRTRQLMPTICAAALGLLFAYGGIYGALRAPPGDFANYYTAARLALEHAFDNPRLYEFYWFNQVLRNDFPGTLGAWIPHPPAMVLPLMPLVWLGPYPAKVAFIAINVALLAPIAALLQRITRLRWQVVVCLILLNGTSLWNNFRQGQLYLVLLLSILLGLWLYLRGNSFWAGVCFGLLTPIKYVPIVFVLYFLARRNWRLVAGAALSIAIVLLLGLVFTSLDLNLFFLTQILSPHLAGRIVNPFTVAFQSYPALLNRLLVYEPSLNAAPALDFTPGRDALKNVMSWSLIALTIFGIRAFASGADLRADLLSRARWFGGGIQAVPTRTEPIREQAAPYEVDRRRTIFTVALLTLLSLVNAPAMATYHLVLMIAPMALLAGLLAERDGKLPAMLIVLYAIVHFFPFSRLYRFDGDGWLTIVAYAKLFLLTAFFLLYLPVGIVRSPAFAVTFVAIAGLSVAFAAIKPSPASDGAIWAGYDGLIIRNLAAQRNRLFYAREVSDGFAAYVNGTPSQESPPPPRTRSQDGTYLLYAAPVRSGLGSSDQIFIQNTSTLAIRQLTFAEGKSIEPVWSQDDRRVYFLSDRGRGIDCTTIYYMDIDQSVKP